jgi:hypothetical protein
MNTIPNINFKVTIVCNTSKSVTAEFYSLARGMSRTFLKMANGKGQMARGKWQMANGCDYLSSFAGSINSHPGRRQNQRHPEAKCKLQIAAESGIIKGGAAAALRRGSK